MNIRHAILLILPVTILTAISNAQLQPADTKPAASASPSSQPAAYQTQMIWFARSGTPTTVELAPTMPRMDRAALLAFGRTWTEAVNTRKQGIKFVADFKVPSVRVPTVFTIAHPDWPNRIMGELVAYPDRDVKWDKKIILYSAGAPKWFDQWAEATGLPVKEVNLAEFKAVNRRKPNDKKHVLVIGRKTAGQKFADTLAIAKKHEINVLVLEAKWFGGKSGKVTVQPKQMAGGLAEFRKQKWSKPLTFRSHRKPWPGIVNRWAWISDKEGLPLVERVWVQANTDKPHPVILLNYVSWQEQLGRSESADQAMLALLLTVSKAEAWNVGGYHGVSVIGWPAELRPGGSDRMLRPFAVSKQRPVLSAILFGPIKATGMGPRYVSILDLRGKQPVTEELRNSLEKRNSVKKTSPERLLILGDDPLLDNWKWAGINRKKKKFKRGGITWLPDDTLPPSAENQIRLMLKLTEFGIPLKHPKPLKGEKKDEKPNK
jgi:hypothetical protein